MNISATYQLRSITDEKKNLIALKVFTYKGAKENESTQNQN
jgi:hypothetical protein